MLLKSAPTLSRGFEGFLCKVFPFSSCVAAWRTVCTRLFYLKKLYRNSASIRGGTSKQPVRDLTAHTHSLLAPSERSGPTHGLHISNMNFLRLRLNHTFVQHALALPAFPKDGPQPPCTYAECEGLFRHDNEVVEEDILK